MDPVAARRGKAQRARRLWWEDLSYRKLLDVRLCDLDLKLPETALSRRIQELLSELKQAGLRHFRPHIWLSTDWFTPDGVTGFAVPFYLAHPRLVRLERRQMFEVEGGNYPWCMKLLRHEAGHALDNAYRLHWRKKWRDIFGRFSESYESDYAPDPTSRNHVQHLGFWYSQSHPAEDFAESFAVWLRPGGRWRNRYRDWPVLRKLEELDALMREIGPEKPKVHCRARPDSMGSLKMTLGEYYEEKKAHYDEPDPPVMDRYLKRVFSAEAAYRYHESAASFLRRVQTRLRNRVANLTHQPRYLVEQAINLMIVRCRELGLRLTRNRLETEIDAAMLVTTLSLRFVHEHKASYRR